MRNILTALLLFAGVYACMGQQAIRSSTALPYLKGSAYARHHTDAFSFTTNQAALAFSNSLMAGMYSERRFLLADLAQFSIAGVLPTKSGSFGFSINHFGGSVYHETIAGLAYGRKLGETVAAGVRFSYYLENAGAYGVASTVSAEAGLLVQLTEQVQAGVQVANPAGKSFGKKRTEKLPTLYSMGFGYEASEQFYITALIEKKESMPVAVTSGFQYHPAKRLFFRAGIVSGPAEFYFGGGFLLNGFRMDAIASVHPQLGVTPALMLLFNVPEPK